MNVANPVVVRMIGANINRRTVANVRKSGLAITAVTDLGVGVFKLIEARKQGAEFTRDERLVASPSISSSHATTP